MKKFFIASVVFAVLIVGTAIIFPHTLHGRVFVKLQVHHPACGAETPLRAILVNDSWKDVTSFAFEVSAYRNGYSTKLETSRYDSDRIVPAGKRFAFCIERPQTFAAYPASTLGRSTYEEFNPNEITYGSSLIFADN